MEFMRKIKRLLREIEDKNRQIDRFMHTIEKLYNDNKYNKSITESLKKISINIERLYKDNRSLANQKECNHDPKNFKVFNADEEIYIYCGDCDKRMKDYNITFKKT